MTTTCPSPIALRPSTEVVYNLSFVPPAVQCGQFAFARINGDISLIQVSSLTASSTLTTIDVKIFRHEFITIFRLSETKTLHHADIRILESIPNDLTRYEEDSDTVYLAKELIEHMRKLTSRRLSGGSSRTSPIYRRRF